jgi:hypothetical protein
MDHRCCETAVSLHIWVCSLEEIIFITTVLTVVLTVVTTVVITVAITVVTVVIVRSKPNPTLPSDRQRDSGIVSERIMSPDAHFVDEKRAMKR